MNNWKDFYASIELTPQEVEAAIFEAKVKKYFRERNKEYWEKLESKSKKQCTALAADQTK